jgi:hypothetical protein
MWYILEKIIFFTGISHMPQVHKARFPCKRGHQLICLRAPGKIRPVGQKAKVCLILAAFGECALEAPTHVTGFQQGNGHRLQLAKDGVPLLCVSAPLQAGDAVQDFLQLFNAMGREVDGEVDRVHHST